MTRTRRRAAALAAGLLVAAGCATLEGDEVGGIAGSKPEAAVQRDEPEHDGDADGAEDAAHRIEHDTPQRRLVVADADSPHLVFVDVASGSVVGEVLLSADVLTHGAATSADGRFVLLPHDDAVSIVDGGAWSVRHGDHAHHYPAAPTLVGQVAGPNPSHLVSGHGRGAFYFDGDGDTLVVDERPLDDGQVDVVATLASGTPHHGFAVPVDGGYVVTIPTAGMGDLPDVLGVADLDGNVHETYDCEATHGETALADGAAAACQHGILLVTEADGWTGRHVGYPTVDDEDPYGYGDARAWVLSDPTGSGPVVAPLGTRHVLVVDLDDGVARALAFDEPVALFGIDIDDAGRLVVLTADGSVRLVDPTDGRGHGHVATVGAFTEGDTAAPFRRLLVADGYAYVSDPADRRVVEVELDTLTFTRTWELDVTPGYLGIINH